LNRNRLSQIMRRQFLKGNERKTGGPNERSAYRSAKERTVPDVRLDEVGLWTEIKLRIIADYSAAYSKILKKQTIIRHFAYIDGFAGAGQHISRATGELIDGSPLIALSHEFSHYHFVDLDGKRATNLRQIAAGCDDVSVYEGDCSAVLLDQVFPQCRYEDYRRALCLLDPYDLNPKWEVVQTAGVMKSIELFIIFMIMDANRNVLLRGSPKSVSETEIAKMTAFWGDESWRDVAYKKRLGLFEEILEKTRNEDMAVAYRERLREVAGFEYVPEPLPMKNSRGAVVYYLYFASQNETGYKVAKRVLDKYRERG